MWRISVKFFSLLDTAHGVPDSVASLSSSIPCSFEHAYTPFTEMFVRLYQFLSPVALKNAYVAFKRYDRH